eukprot:scaffold9886_cov143-Skeletonema_menzelii.AAC.4
MRSRTRHFSWQCKWRHPEWRRHQPAAEQEKKSNQHTHHSSKMNESCTKENSSALSNDEFDDLLEQCNVISIPGIDNAAPPIAADNRVTPLIDYKGIRDNDVIVVPNLAGLSELPGCVDNNRIFVAVNVESTLYESKSTPIDAVTSTHRHYFYIENNDCLKLKSLNFSVVFSGVFDGPDYEAAQIDVNLKRLSSEREPISAHLVGKKTLKSHNSIDSIGAITIDHEIESNVIESGLFELTVTAASKSSYSIGVSGCFARRADLEVTRLTAELEEKQQRIEKCKSAHQSLFYLEQLLERKIKVVEDLKEHDRLSIDTCKEKLDRLEEELDRSDGTEDEDTFLLRKIDALSIKHRHFHSLNVQKEDKSKDLTSKLEDVKLEIEKMLKEKQRLFRDTGEIKVMLSAVYVRFGFLAVECVDDHRHRCSGQ